MNQEQTGTRAKDKARDVADEARKQAGDVKETVQDKAKDVAGVAQEKAGQVAHEAEAEARRVGQTVEDEARSMAAMRKRQVSSELHSVAQAFHSSGDQLREQGQDTIAGYTDQMAERLDRAAVYLEHRKVDDIVRDAEDFARRQPEVFLAGAFGLGVLAARFLKSGSGSSQRQRSSQRGQSAGGYGTRRQEYPVTQRPRPLPQQDASERARLYPREEGTELG